MATRLLTTQRIVNLSSDPVSANSGEVYFNTSSNIFRYYNGSSWQDLASGAGITVSTTAPTSPSEGDLWFDSDNANVYIYYDSSWVQVGGGGGGGGTVTSVGVSVPTGLSVANSPVTAAGTIAISLASGYAIPTTTALDAKAPLISPTFTTPDIGVATGTSFNSITGLSSTNPVMNGTVAIGTGTTAARADHVHASDTTRAALSGATFTGTVIAPAATTSLAPIRIPHGTAPTSPTNGDVWTTTTGVFARINGTTVGPLGAGGGGASVSDSAPTSPTSGALWYNSLNGKTYVYYQDGTSNQWVEVGAATIDVTANYDGGTPTSVYGGISDIDGGGV
jgi:hypothetical protein